MYQSFEFYEARAQEAALEADAATLDNVKQRNLRAEKSWTRLAELARKVATDRAKAEQAKTEKRNAELGLQLSQLN
ncbi:hypothetical protein [Qipengyuania gelatinilytica]|uniref:Uncharacterized protein n=1 Tax=Qipengyuania gelatinilytica TaxID=2867231 RepID=A0ABX9A3P9_9SPHN|nr:hypothetical protein [Qipengyuania gelatinilytica]QZD95860.1 hypothetical protein K3136_03865 [Qipengyuania gelatinilytica]